MDKPKVTPKDFFLWAGAMVALYVSVFSFISLLFEYISYAYPDPLNYDYVDPYSGAMRFAIASLIVLLPVFLVLMRLIRRDIARVPEKRDLWVRRWALFLTVFAAGAAVIVDLIALINYFLGGDLTTQFVLKVMVVLLVAGGAFLHFLADVRGYWVQFPERANRVGYAVAVLVTIAIVSGFFIMGTPSEIRMFRFDDQKINDLTSIQWQIVNYWQQKEKLPATLTDLNDPISGFIVPTDPQSGAEYIYEGRHTLSLAEVKASPPGTGTYSFKLCATFNAPSQGSSVTMPRGVAPVPVGAKGGLGLEQSTWNHGAGPVCFERTIDPELYPPFRKSR